MRKILRMDNSEWILRTFEHLLSWVAPVIQRTSLWRSAATPERLLRYLTTGDSQITIGTSFRISPTTMGRIISETRQALRRVLSEKVFIRAPDSEEEWLTIAAEFNGKGNFPYCLGAIEKRVLIQASAGRQSDGGKYSSSNQGQAVDQDTHGGVSLILTILYSTADFLVLEG